MRYDSYDPTTFSVDGNITESYIILIEIIHLTVYLPQFDIIRNRSDIRIRMDSWELECYHRVVTKQINNLMFAYWYHFQNASITHLTIG